MLASDDAVRRAIAGIKELQVDGKFSAERCCRLCGLKG